MGSKLYSYAKLTDQSQKQQQQEQNDQSAHTREQIELKAGGKR